MKVLVEQLKNFVSGQKPMLWFLVLLFCAAGTAINYTTGLKAYLRSLEGTWAFVGYFLLYASFLLTGYLLLSIVNKDFKYWRKPGFIVLLCSGIAIFAFRSSFQGHAQWIESVSSDQQAYINSLVYSDLFRLIYLLVPVAIIWFVADRNTQPLYGFSMRNHKPVIYFLLLLCMIPFLVFASTQSDFLAYYPRIKKLTAESAPVYKLLIYELCYGLDFIAIELFFRGFMVMAFARYAGINSVLPMACFYLAIHFGKPAGEAVSSFFGGTILGVIAYHSRSIYGGVIIHVGIAWLMEAGALVGNLLKSAH